jgi:uncharacterized protein (TIGR02265 family)
VSIGSQGQGTTDHTPRLAYHRRVAERFRTVTEVPLAGDIDLARVLSEIPSDYALKGMFFSRYVSALGDAYADAAIELQAPPTSGRFHAFESYPMADYLRLFDRVARARFPGSTREAYRLLARGELDVFADSTLGKVTLSLLREPGSALLKYPEVFPVLGRGPRVTAERRDDRRVTVTYDRYYGAVEYAIGVLEGIVLAFEEEPRLEVTVEDTRRTTIEVVWGAPASLRPPVSSRR